MTASKRIIWTLMILMLGCHWATAQGQVDWMSWDEAVEAAESRGSRKVIVDIYTDWCGWCKKMDKATFQNPTVTEYLNDHYYAVKFNAEQRGTIRVGDREYKYVGQGRRGYHELAAALTQNNLSYPTVVFLDETMSVIQALKGYHGPKEFEMIMHFFGDNHYKTTPWNTFTATRKH